MPKAIGIIPARFQSKRFPGKPLALLGGLPLIVRLLRTVMDSRLISEVAVATDDLRIADTVRGHDGRVIMTSSDPLTGSDRVAEAADQFPDADIVVNIQCDEPFISGDVIDKVVGVLQNPGIVMSTACARISDPADADNPNVVKAVLDSRGDAIYFSRSRIPYNVGGKSGQAELLRHIGIYGFKRDFLMKFASLKRTPLEISENLEQLRALEHGFKIRSVVVDGHFPGIDTEEDLFKAERMLAVKGQAPDRQGEKV